MSYREVGGFLLGGLIYDLDGFFEIFSVGRSRVVVGRVCFRLFSLFGLLSCFR